MLKDYILLNGNTTKEVLAVTLDKFKLITLGNSITCDDNNILTNNDQYINSICVGIDIKGVLCDNLNEVTINNIYVKGVCIGTNV